MQEEKQSIERGAEILENYDGNEVVSISNAVRLKDWEELRRMSLRSKGFRKERGSVWPFLLHVYNDGGCSSKEAPKLSNLRRRKPPPTLEQDSELDIEEKDRSILAQNSEHVEKEEKPHSDEHQIKLDTDRSFVLYSLDDETMSRDEMQSMLNSLITSVFRSRPRLSYFQGYHDIVTVILLTVPPEEQVVCAEKLSLHRLRDAMGEGLEPLLGLLHIMKYLMRLVDPSFAELLERVSPLPYFALSNLLTLFSHDVPTLALIQHVFDYILCRPPICVVYLATAFTLSRKDEALAMEAEGEEGMLHSLLTALPELSDGDEQHEAEESSNVQDVESNILTDRLKESEVGATRKEHFQAESEIDSVVIALSNEAAEPSKLPDTDVESGSEAGGSSQGEPELSGKSQQSDTSLPGSSIASNLSSVDLKSSSESTHDESAHAQSSSHDHPRAASPAPSSASTSSRPNNHKRPIIPLPYLLSEADRLYAIYPPSLPALHLNDILGPQSVVNTWSEDPRDLPTDDEAEAMARHTSLIVKQFVDPAEAAARAAETDIDTRGGKARGRKHKLRRSRRFRFPYVRLDQKTVLTGTVVTLAVAVAIYQGYNSRSGTNNVGFRKSLSRLARAASTKVVGGAERLLDGMGWSPGR